MHSAGDAVMPSMTLSWDHRAGRAELGIAVAAQGLEALLEVRYPALAQLLGDFLDVERNAALLHLPAAAALREDCVVRLRIAVFGLLLWLVLVSTSWTQDGGTWETRAAMPESRQELASAVLNGKLYVIGGYETGFRSTTTVQVYNPATDTWALAHPLPYVVNHNSAAVAGGKLHSFGAVAGESYVYDPNGNSWSAKASSLLRQL